MDTIKFAQLVSLLPRGDEFLSKSLPKGLKYIEKSNLAFVEPELRVEKPIEPGKTSLVLLSAPGAVGKSTFASELAHRTGATLWDLSQLQVGSRTFAGTIMEAYDFEATGVQKRIRNGQFLFILDALDEAQVRAGSHNFDAFIDDLVIAHQEPREQPTAILFARVDTADWIHLHLDDRGVPFARYEIELFDEDRANEFIEKRLDRLHRESEKSSLHREQPKPFNKARQELFELIYHLFGVAADEAWQDRQVQDFLGYAPVLEPLSDYLDVDNYFAFTKELDGGAGAANDPWEFLGEIIDRLLRREEEKVRSAIRGNIESDVSRLGWSDWESLYQGDEQCARVLGRALKVQSSPSGIDLPPAVARLYEDALETILPQHPFLSGYNFSSVVFKEYVFAWGIVSGNSSLASNLRARMRSVEEPFLPSQLYSHFIMNVSTVSDPLLDGRDFGLFYESCLLRSADVLLSLFQLDDLVQAIVLLDQETGHELMVKLMDTGQGIQLSKRLRQAEVEVNVGISIGSPGQRFSLGPSVELRCKELTLVSEELEVDVKGDVQLVAQTFSAEVQPTKLRIRNEGDGRLSVTWPEVVYPWVPFREEAPKTPAVLSETQRGEVMRKFLMMFRRQRTRKERTIMSARWSEEEIEDRDDLIQKALEFEVLERVGGRDIFKFNSTFDSLKVLVGEAGEVSEEAKQFLRSYLGTEQAERVMMSG